MNIYITLDYELFLGERTGTPQNCLIRPMDELCKVADKHHFKFIIFVDAAYLLRMYQLKDRFKQVESDFILVRQHIQMLVSQGHDVELHFHPQWLYSEWSELDNAWKLNQTHYKLSDMESEFAFTSFKQGKELLEEIIGYKTIAFRAGGFCLDDFSSFYELLTVNQISIDSSVARFDHISSTVHKYDYRIIPNKQIYKIKDSLKREDPSGAISEYSISSVTWSSIQYLLKIRPIKQKFKYIKLYGDGNSISDKKSIFIERIKKLFSKVVNLASIDFGSSELLDIYYNSAIENNSKEIILIGHPKNLTDTSLYNLDKWVRKHKSDFVIKTFRWR